MTVLSREHKWIVVSKDRALVVTRGFCAYDRTVKSKTIKEIGTVKEKGIFYNNKIDAEAGIATDDFYPSLASVPDEISWRQENLEAVPVIITIEEITDGESA